MSKQPILTYILPFYDNRTNEVLMLGNLFWKNLDEDVHDIKEVLYDHLNSSWDTASRFPEGDGILFQNNTTNIDNDMSKCEENLIFLLALSSRFRYTINIKSKGIANQLIKNRLIKLINEYK